MLAPTASLNNLATSSYNSNAAHTPRCRFTSLQLHTTPLTLRANLATMRAPRPAKAETLGSQPSMISNRGWSLSMMISTVLCVQGAGPIRKMTAADRFCRSPVYPGVFRSTDVFTSPGPVDRAGMVVIILLPRSSSHEVDCRFRRPRGVPAGRGRRTGVRSYCLK